MHSAPKLFLFADIPEAGRFNMDCMSQQMIMEALCADVDNLQAFQDANGEFIPIESWEGLKFDSDGNVSKINFDSKFGCNLFLNEGEEPVDENPPIGPGGSMDLQWIPHSVISFSISDVEISGSVDTSILPRGLEEFDISFNSFRGEFSMAGLPGGLRILNVQGNELSGSLIIADIPRRVYHFNISDNAFSGEINFGDLPPNLSVFYARKNKLYGTISLQRLPESIQGFAISGNDFAQDVLVVRAKDMWKYGRFRLDTHKFGKIIDEAGTDVTDKFQA